jgi:hypothetical protein
VLHIDLLPVLLSLAILAISLVVVVVVVAARGIACAQRVAHCPQLHFTGSGLLGVVHDNLLHFLDLLRNVQLGRPLERGHSKRAFHNISALDREIAEEFVT